MPLTTHVSLVRDALRRSRQDRPTFRRALICMLCRQEVTASILHIVLHPINVACASTV
ncbi:uncharacterized protein LACBIDRAFT_308432 [Laccaria bicolor S238N-H82]|uniref:Predicted protein n=1 Tax=Laccaria bicolor (strain S238N-H82 / ATCC MYA-4686) TaxID=486041 RepID=B0CW98_LACBS|nr:uncharacterized protein LACBIDRAFT_308432 [Laccaria bicolor S238N-H82]EDR13471.1 predicted protein [Laccaria bicolor S238N-H82]|eukprot:XP_001875969.1 predicted protein [Laccaria bicolor S238N-H82]